MSDGLAVCSLCRALHVADGSENDFACGECGERLCPECNDENRRADDEPDACPFCDGRIATDSQLLEVACDLLGASRADLVTNRQMRLAHPDKERRYIVYDPDGDTILTETPLTYDDAKAIADELDDVLIVEWRGG